MPASGIEGMVRSRLGSSVSGRRVVIEDGGRGGGGGRVCYDIDILSIAYCRPPGVVRAARHWPGLDSHGVHGAAAKAGDKRRGRDGSWEWIRCREVGFCRKLDLARAIAFRGIWLLLTFLS